MRNKRLKSKKMRRKGKSGKLSKRRNLRRRLRKM